MESSSNRMSANNGHLGPPSSSRTLLTDPRSSFASPYEGRFKHRTPYPLRSRAKPQAVVRFPADPVRHAPSTRLNSGVSRYALDMLDIRRLQMRRDCYCCSSHRDVFEFSLQSINIIHPVESILPRLGVDPQSRREVGWHRLLLFNLSLILIKTMQHRTIHDPRKTWSRTFAESDSMQMFALSASRFSEVNLPCPLRSPIFSPPWCITTSCSKDTQRNPACHTSCRSRIPPALLVTFPKHCACCLRH